ncbi:MAG: hypothetical protein QNJ89_07105 [Acidimicrobiia bacterium]|nr:hypothetical protein [Acidimicrobiia bacterium]
METLVTIHSWVRWLVLLALLTGAVIGVYRYRAQAGFEPGLFQIAAMTVDIQVAIGIVIWIVDDGWSETFFFKVLHPAFMLAALAVAHIGLAVGKRRNDVRSNVLAGGSSLLALVLVVMGIPWDRL